MSGLPHLDLVVCALVRMYGLGYVMAPSAAVAEYVPDGRLDHIQINRIGRRAPTIAIGTGAVARYCGGMWTIGAQP